MAKLKRISDGAGDEGELSMAIRWNDNKTFKEVVSDKPTIGCSMYVGAVTARSYQHQDYWLTTEITEIIKDNGDYI